MRQCKCGHSEDLHDATSDDLWGDPEFFCHAEGCDCLHFEDSGQMSISEVYGDIHVA